ncbi:MAG: hypothetical protein LLG01_14385 [Planctomycetaceae bacterium]|nr:hypothetical protein [Planctomycetaceae bacterium]
MMDLTNIPILADAENVLVIVGIIIAVIVSLVKKAAAKAKEAQEEQARQAQQPPVQPQAAPMGERRPAAAPARDDRSQALRQTLQNLGIVLDEEPAAPSVPPPLPNAQQRRQGQRRPAPQRRDLAQVEAQEDLAQSVDQEMLRQQQRMSAAESSRQQRMGELHIPEEDSAAIEQRLLHVRPAQQGHKAALSPLAALLANRDTARKAIVLQEILSPPKALRHGQEMWEA